MSLKDKLKEKEYRKQYYLLNRERILARCKIYQEQNKEKKSLYHKK